MTNEKAIRTLADIKRQFEESLFAAELEDKDAIQAKSDNKKVCYSIKHSN